MGLSKFKSAVVLISKQFEVKATFDGMIESSFAISSLSKGYSPQKHWNALYAQEICGVRPTGFSKNEIFRRFLTKDVATRELEPAKSAYAVVEFNMMPETVYVAFTFV